MSVWNVFDSDAFSLNSLTAAINHVPYQPGVIGGLGIFSEQGISTTTALIEENNGVLSLVSVAPRNGVGQVVSDSKRAVRSFAVPHMPERATIMADEVQGVRAFGSESNATSIEIKRDERLADMRRNLDYTLESHRLAAIMGNYVDVNGATQSLATAFGVVAPTQVDFLLGTSTTKVRGKCMTAIEAIEAGLGGVAFSGVIALCGKTFWSSLIDHAALAQTVTGWQAAQTLRDDPRLAIEFGGIRFVRYRGTSAVKIGDSDAYAFAAGVPDLFITRFAPANYMETVNTIGLPVYAKAEALPLGKGVQIEAQTNALNLCTRPASVVKLTTSN